jgi:hypothetical protein
MKTSVPNVNSKKIIGGTRFHEPCALKNPIKKDHGLVSSQLIVGVRKTGHLALEVQSPRLTEAAPIYR